LRRPSKALPVLFWYGIRGRDIGVTKPLLLVFLYQLPQSLGNGCLIRFVLFCLSAEAVVCSLVCNLLNLALTEALLGTASKNPSPSVGGVGNDPADVLSRPWGRATQPSAECCSGLVLAAIVCSLPYQPSQFVLGNSGTAQATTLGQEAFSGVAFVQKALHLVAQLVPELVELVIVGTVDNVDELVQHRVQDLLEREKLAAVARMP